MDKKSAEEVLKQLGMPMSTLVTLLLKQVTLTKSIPFSISLPEVPHSISVDHMSPEEFGTMMLNTYKAAENGESRPANDFFDELRNENL